MGRERQSHASGRGQYPRVDGRARGRGLDAIVINTSGCGTTVKDYGHMFRTDAAGRDAATVGLGARCQPRC
jgi:glycolate oxidase iron-sulfur subunit